MNVEAFINPLSGCLTKPLNISDCKIKNYF